MKSRPHGEPRRRTSLRSHWVVGIAIAICIFGLTASLASAAPPPPAGGFTPAGAYPSDPPLTPQQQQYLKQKEAALAAWIKTDGAHQTDGVLQTKVIQPDCVIDEWGNCMFWVTVSLGGQYTIEPRDQPNWCGPGAATAVAMHWDPNGVKYNHTPYSAKADPNWGGYWTTYSNEQGWMA